MSLDAIYNRDVTDVEPHELLIVTWPDERLETKCEDITRFDDEDNKHLEQFVLDMTYTMIRSQGIGLAAPQVGVMANIIVLLADNKPLILVNPEILSQSDTLFSWQEGCLSVPGHFENRKRPNNVVVKFQDIFGEEHEAEFTGLWAFAVQHEIDHINGVCFVDNLSFFKRGRVKSKVAKAVKAWEKARA